LVTPELENAVLREEQSVRRIDALFRRWKRDRDDLDALRSLRDAISDYLQNHVGR
jgi:hypothetical protein